MNAGVTRRLPSAVASPPYAIVLAGGSGERLRAVTERWLGEPRPKQYCTFVGTRCMLQHTWDRVTAVVPRANVLTVIAEEHERFLVDSVRGPVPGTLVRQPVNRGTAAGVFLPLAYVVERDPDATVMIFPCDHFIYPEGRFLQYVLAAYRLCHRFRGSLLLLGVPATSAETDYGWIEAEPWTATAAGPLRRVSRFVEKPSPAAAARLLERGGLWNTMIVGARASTLWNLGRMLLPDLLEPFETLRRVLQGRGAGSVTPGDECDALRHLYRRLPTRDFSADFLRLAATSAMTLPLDDLLWSDWGRPKRVMNTLREVGLDAAPRLAHAF
jgi:mannose-1-phosphate guanylyltransferase